MPVVFGSGSGGGGAPPDGYNPSSGVAGIVQLSDGAGANTSDPLLIFDTVSDLLGVGVGVPTESIDTAGAIKLGDAVGTADGTFRFTGTDFEGRVSGAWQSLTGGGGGTPAGADTQIQFNNAGAFGASANLTWDDTNRDLSFAGGAATIASAMNLTIAIAGIDSYRLNQYDISAIQTSSSFLLDVTDSTPANPTLVPNRSSLNTGLGGPSGELSLIIAGIEATRIDASGQLGVGTSSPGSTLDVQGTTNLGKTVVAGTDPGKVTFADFFDFVSKDIVVPIGGVPVSSVDVGWDIPAEAMVMGVAVNIQSAITGAGGCTAVGVGEGTTYDKYAETSTLTLDSKDHNSFGGMAALIAPQDIKVFATDGAGALTGTIQNGSIRIRVVYATMTALPNA